MNRLLAQIVTHNSLVSVVVIHVVDVFIVFVVVNKISIKKIDHLSFNVIIYIWLGDKSDFSLCLK